MPILRCDIEDVSVEIDGELRSIWGLIYVEFELRKGDTSVGESRQYIEITNYDQLIYWFDDDEKFADAHLCEPDSDLYNQIIDKCEDALFFQIEQTL